MSKSTFLLLLCILSIQLVHAKNYKLSSPDKKIEVAVSDGKELKWSVSYNEEIILKPSRISMTIKERNVLFGINTSVRKVEKKTVNDTFEAVIPTKFRNVHDNYNEMRLLFEDDYVVTFRVYNNGAAYRFETTIPSSIIQVEEERVEFNLADDYSTYWPKETSPNFITHCEGHLEFRPVSSIPNQEYAFLPIYFSSRTSPKIVITEADLFDYPNLFLSGTAGQLLNGVYFLPLF